MSMWKTCMQEVKIAKTELFEGTTCQICTVHCVHLSLQFLFGLSLSESYEIAVCKNKQQKCPHSHKIWLWIFCLMRAISIKKSTLGYVAIFHMEGHTLNTYWILEVNVEIWGDQKMVVWRPEHYRSLNPPILADSQDPPFSRLLISWIYWIYSIYNFGLHPWSSFRAVSYLIYSIYLTYILADTQDPSYVAFSSTPLTVEKQIMALVRGRGQTYPSLTLSNKDCDEDLFPGL